jgi:hypothetical protein
MPVSSLLRACALQLVLRVAILLALGFISWGLSHANITFTWYNAISLKLSVRPILCYIGIYACIGHSTTVSFQNTDLCLYNRMCLNEGSATAMLVYLNVDRCICSEKLKKCSYYLRQVCRSICARESTGKPQNGLLL